MNNFLFFVTSNAVAVRVTSRHVSYLLTDHECVWELAQRKFAFKQRI